MSLCWPTHCSPSSWCSLATEKTAPIPADPVRALARWLNGATGGDQLSAWPAEVLIGLLAREGVLGLAAARAAGHAGDLLPTALRAALGKAGRDAALTSMLLEVETRRVLAALETVGTPSLLLKGSALAYWAYPQPQDRSCGDVDIFVPSRHTAERLAGALERMGFRRAGTSGDLVAYELMCTSQVTPEWALEIDVHWRLSNSTLFENRFGFEELLAQSVAIPSLGPHARGLGPTHAMLHAAMHRTSNLTSGVGDHLKWLYDFVVLSRHLSTSDWERMTELALERKLAGVTLDALQATSAMFSVTWPASVTRKLLLAAQHEPFDASRASNWRYAQLKTLQALPGIGHKVKWLWQRLFPSGDYMRYLYGEQRSYAGLLGIRARQAWRRWAGN